MAARKSKRTLVLLHGLGGCAADWTDAGVPLAKHFTIQALDLPGSFRGPQSPGGYEPAALARWVIGTLPEEPVFLAGHSLGGRVAGEIAALAPDRVKALALVSPLGAAPYGFTDTLKWKAMSRRAVLESVPESSLRSAAAYGFEGDAPGKQAFVARAVEARTGPGKRDVAAATEKCVDGVLGAPPLAERLKGTTMPLLVATGALDPLVPPRDARAILEARPDATFLELPGRGHYALLEDAERLAEVLRKFFARP
ncbi:MAG: alpha/beta hydrolase [Thermoanaerobaculia bacterium]|jgi:pyruvate dehydrogenase E2 component (dihydrolipoamide acetyltransferase)